MCMIHNAHTLGVGNAADFRELAERLDAIDEELIKDYMATSGQTRAKIVSLMEKERFLSAKEAVDLGFFEAVQGKTPPKADSEKTAMADTEMKNVKRLAAYAELLQLNAAEAA